MKTRLLFFPLATAAVMALEGCEGVSLTDPSVKVCHDDTTRFLVRWPDGQVDTGLVITHADTMHCRKVA